MLTVMSDTNWELHLLASDHEEWAAGQSASAGWSNLVTGHDGNVR